MTTHMRYCECTTRKFCEKCMWFQNKEWDNVKDFIEKNQQWAKDKDRLGYLPLHTAIINNAPVGVISKIVNAWGGAVSVGDSLNKTAHDMADEYNRSDEVKSLVSPDRPQRGGSKKKRRRTKRTRKRKLSKKSKKKTKRKRRKTRKTRRRYSCT